MVFKPKVHLFITLSYNKQNNESAPLGIGNMQKLGVKGNISYIVFVNVMIFCLINKCSFIKFSFLCTKGQVDCFHFSGFTNDDTLSYRF